MRICPACNATVVVIITDLATGKRFCHHCADLPFLLLTLKDIRFLLDCGIDPQVANLEKLLRGDG
jgi:hypothetical protein